MCDDDAILGSIVIGAILIAMVIGLIVHNITRTTYQREAVQHGYAIHNPVNGNWMWMDDYVKSTNKVVEVEKEK